MRFSSCRSGKKWNETEWSRSQIQLLISKCEREGEIGNEWNDNGKYNFPSKRTGRQSLLIEAFPRVHLINPHSTFLEFLRHTGTGQL